MPNPAFASRRAAFRKLHASGCFVIPNPWDIGSARYLQSLGFPALATTSAGFAFSRGLADNAVSRDLMLAHIGEIVSAVEVPVNADFEAGFATNPEQVALNVRLCIETGVAGLSIEDATGDAAAPLYDLELAVARIHAARAAIDGTNTGVLLVARAECFLTKHPRPLEEAIRRLQRYAEAGADVLYAPGPEDRDSIAAIVTAVKPKPVNILMSGNSGMTVADLAAIGVRRISTGSALARSAWGGFQRAAKAIATQGSFAEFDHAAPFRELNNFFRKDVP